MCLLQPAIPFQFAHWLKVHFLMYPYLHPHKTLWVLEGHPHCYLCGVTALVRKALYELGLFCTVMCPLLFWQVHWFWLSGLVGQASKLSVSGTEGAIFVFISQMAQRGRQEPGHT
jgi:hypothetical protein